ncbi:hypothetical protein AMECASPLE_023177 [Ameca splendens]|uniref:Uncharacterized protein n=1 Tax=Ameca splendens TaxID=208324 RepID=A0ABV0ZNV7_9TELE
MSFTFIPNGFGPSQIQISLSSSSGPFSVTLLLLCVRIYFIVFLCSEIKMSSFEFATRLSTWETICVVVRLLITTRLKIQFITESPQHIKGGFKKDELKTWVRYSTETE